MKIYKLPNDPFKKYKKTIIAFEIPKALEMEVHKLVHDFLLQYTPIEYLRNKEKEKLFINMQLTNNSKNVITPKKIPNNWLDNFNANENE